MGAREHINKVLIFIVIIAIVLKYLPLSQDTKLALGYSKNSFLNFTEVTAKNQYRSEEHTVVTEDGYVLTMFRITKGRNCHHPKKQRPVLIMHGLLENSDVFLDAGPSAGLAYLLSDACYDVWVGNQRGNNYARRHIKLNPDKDADFWQFSVEEVGLYDVPALVDHILQNTGVDKLNYIGFSQGCTAYFIMCSERPDYRDKTAVMIALAPAVILVNQESVLLKTIFNSALFFKRILEMFGIHEIFSKGTFNQELMEYVCQVTGPSWTGRLCGSVGYLDSYNPGSMTSDTQQLVFSHTLMGTSLNTLVQYGQVLHSGRFQKFDYGETINLRKYNSTQAPEYNLSAVSTPVLIIQGKSDKLIGNKDTKVVSRRLPNVLELVEVSDPKWNHFDMLYNRDIKTMIYPKINEYLQKYSEN
ncbi:lipase 1-like [Epargyreus clarus]|uniref:lipase 1-like n=1 Tax=Epargyreus clarus TaxID=520877 RepID=UPI003C2E9DE1